MSAAGRPRLALMMCVNNEADTILDHLRYHQHQGVTGAYVYLDHCTDATATRLRGIDWVEAVEASRPADCPGLPAHQVNCAVDALRRARRDGFDWLMHIDPDEYAWAAPPGEGPTEPGGLVAMLDRARPETEMVELATLEVLPERGLGARPFWEQCYFQGPGQLVKRDMLDPGTGEIRQMHKWAGHQIGKSILRTACDAVPRWAHGWQRPGEVRGAGRVPQEADARLVTEKLGFHYHFVFMGARLWRQKYRKLAWEPDTWITGGKVPFPKQAWKEATLAFGDAEAEAYYERWIGLAPERLAGLAASGAVTRDTRLRDAMRALPDITPGQGDEKWTPTASSPVIAAISRLFSRNTPTKPR